MITDIILLHFTADTAKLGLVEARLAIIPGGGEWNYAVIEVKLSHLVPL